MSFFYQFALKAGAISMLAVVIGRGWGIAWKGMAIVTKWRKIALPHVIFATIWVSTNVILDYLVTN